MPLLPLVSVHPSIMSSYDAGGRTGGPRAELRPLALRPSGVLIPRAAEALYQLHLAVQAAGGDLRITDCHRSYSVQAAARQEYESGRKKAYVAEAGRSNHNGGRAVDFHTSPNRFPGVPADKQLDRMWEIMRPLGWSPIIPEAREGASESWHIEFRDELSHVYGSDGPGYADAALIGALLVGHAGRYADGIPGASRLIQALAHRAGADVGAIDGAIGPTTRAGLAALLGTVPATPEATIAALATLPTPGRYIWRKK